jgi:threonine dehydrogenase-like Zn-dependent dehydrogenase
MKAAVIVKNNRLKILDVPEPQPGDYQAKCEILFGAVCSGTDSHLIDGSLRFRSPLPTILGHESIGRVIATGRNVRHLKPGDLVTRVGAPAMAPYSISWGGFAEFGIAVDHQAMEEDGRPQAEWGKFRIHRKIPASFDPAAATMIITWRETLSYLTRMGVHKGASLLVIGTGGNGLAYAAHARNIGLKQITLLGAPERARQAKKAGATHFINYRHPDPGKALAAQMPAGYDFVIDAVGSQASVNTAMAALKDGGILGLYGLNELGRVTLNPALARGTFTFSNKGYAEYETHTRVVNFIKAGQLDASVWLTNIKTPWTLDTLPEAFAATRQRKVVKALIRIRG